MKCMPKARHARGTCVALAALSSILVAQAADIHVPGDQPTVQAGIDAAANGDRVLVDEGTYPEAIDFLGKDIQVLATGNLRRTVLVAPAGERVVTFRSGEPASAVLAGFRIEGGLANGSADDGLGGGMLVSGTASPEIRDNFIHLNEACNGGGIAVVGSAQPHIHDNRISHNVARGCGPASDGGGVYTSSSALFVLEHNQIENNRASRGGGVAVSGEPVVHRSNTVVARNKVFSNQGDALGGGIFTQGDRVRIADNLIFDNVSPYGAGIRVEAYNRTAHPVIVGNTIADDTGGGVEVNAYAEPDGAIAIANNIIVHDIDGYGVRCDGGSGKGITLYDNLLRSAGYVGDCIVQGALITADPQFVGGSHTARAFRLKPQSPAIDAGDSSLARDKLDLTGGPRIRGASVDLGAIEFRPD